ncbi:MAG: zinc-ribbon domain-containing protein [Desulfobacterales bacterium]|nr:zinc-ribbon domain-containing protein [Desulfobacterales bacterium]MBF0396335.1 zinc-ribbon domain-containing protein [Desulfobacterales bacterium]
MAIVCEECGKIYSIDENKLNKLIEKKSKVKCTECGSIFTVTKPPKENFVEEEPPLLDEDLLSGSEEDEDFESKLEEDMEKEKGGKDEEEEEEEIDFSTIEMEAAPIDETPSEAVAPQAKASAQTSSAKVKGLGLRGKMFILFLIIPLILMAFSGYFSQKQLGSLAKDLNLKTTEVVKALASDVNKQSTTVVRQLAEENMTEKARDVAIECKIYLAAHPELKKESFFDNQEFKSIALQKVGRTGYTVLIEMAEKDEEVKIWVHETPMLIGVPAMQVLQEALGKDWPHFYKSLIPAKGGNETRFYYNWKEEDGSMREKFMAVSPVKGTKYAILATTYIDEFTGPITKLESYYMTKFNEENTKLNLYASEVTETTRNITLAIFIGTLIIVGFTIAVYSHKITQAIKYLTIAADRISVGELDTEIKVTSKDEIGKLAEAISRMQDSLRVSIQRLRRRR